MLQISLPFQLVNILCDIYDLVHLQWTEPLHGLGRLSDLFGVRQGGYIYIMFGKCVLIVATGMAIY